jgi:hypothetical protein
VGKERIALEHHAGVAAPGRKIGDLGAADPDHAAGRLDEARDHPQRRRLAASGRAEEDEELPVGNLEVHAPDGVMVAVALREVPELEPRHQTTCEIFT